MGKNLFLNQGAGSIHFGKGVLLLCILMLKMKYRIWFHYQPPDCHSISHLVLCM
jgi:hypothetical protein